MTIPARENDDCIRSGEAPALRIRHGKIDGLLHAVGGLEAEYGLSVWQDWLKEPDFPVAVDGLLERLGYVEDRLRSLLARTPHPTKKTKFRRDLNGPSGAYRVWILKAVLRRLISVSIPLGLPDGAAARSRFPEDLPRVADDIRILLERHRQMPLGSRSVTAFRDPDDLGDAVRQWRGLFPIGMADRLAAHRAHLASHDFTGDGGAVLLAVLDDGTEVLSIRTRAASVAYGSPRWCTAYAGLNNRFKDYSDGLVYVIDPDGQRWGVHCRKWQWMDGDDKPLASVGQFLHEREGLAQAMAYEWESAVDGEFAVDAMLCADEVPAWLGVMKKKWADEYAAWERDRNEFEWARTQDVLAEAPKRVVRPRESYWIVRAMRRDIAVAKALLWGLPQSVVMGANMASIRNHLWLTLQDEYVDRMTHWAMAALKSGYYDRVEIGKMLALFADMSDEKARVLMWTVPGQDFAAEWFAPLRDIFARRIPREYAECHLNDVLEVSRQYTMVRYASDHCAWIWSHFEDMRSKILWGFDASNIGYADANSIRSLMMRDLPRGYADKMARPLAVAVGIGGAEAYAQSHLLWILGQFPRLSPEVVGNLNLQKANLDRIGDLLENLWLLEPAALAGRMAAPLASRLRATSASVTDVEWLCRIVVEFPAMADSVIQAGGQCLFELDVAAPLRSVMGEASGAAFAIARSSYESEEGESARSAEVAPERVLSAAENSELLRQLQRHVGLTLWTTGAWTEERLRNSSETSRSVFKRQRSQPKSLWTTGVGPSKRYRFTEAKFHAFLEQRRNSKSTGTRTDVVTSSQIGTQSPLSAFKRLFSGIGMTLDAISRFCRQ